MIQFNLLPDVKLEYIKAHRTKHTIILLSTIIGAATLGLFVLSFIFVNIVQKKHLSDLNNDISQSTKDLKSKPDLAKILTIQNQLNSLPALHDQKPVASRLLGYVQQLTPQNVSVSGLTVNFKDQTMKIEGSSDSIATVNTFVDTLKFTNYVAAAPNSSTSTPTVAFKNVVLAFAVAATTQKDKNKGVTYSITLKYDKAIFENNKNITLQVANKITTRSETEKPSAVFQAKPVDVNGGAN